MNIINVIIKVSTKICQILLEYIRELFHLCNPMRNIQHHPDISPEDSFFININSNYWKKNKKLKKDIILIEGFFAASGHNYLLRTGMLAKAIQEKLNFTIMVLFSKPSYKLTVERKKYQSFEINEFIFIKPGLRAVLNYVKAVKIATQYYLSLKRVNDLPYLKHDGILLGDLIYDDLLKSENIFTIKSIELICFKRLAQSFYYFYWYTYICKRYPVKYVIVTHLVYAQYGILARVALKNNINVVETNDLMMNHLRANDYLNKLIAPTFHSVMNAAVLDYIKKYKDTSSLADFATQNLKRRMMGTVEQYDARFAFKNKAMISKIEFLRKLKISTKNPSTIVVIFAHIFSDAPHSSEKLLFNDYYHWLVETLSYIHKIKEVSWIVKPHPSSKLYNEEGAVEVLVNNVQSGSSYKNIFVFPEGITTANLSEIASAIVTVQGTPGIEFSCIGLPVILAGKPFYSRQGFTYDPETKEEYYSLLSNIRGIPGLDEHQIHRAKLIYGAFAKIIGDKSNIIATNALNAIWGYTPFESPNIELGNRIINNGLEKNDPRNELQFVRLKKYLAQS